MHLVILIKDVQRMFHRNRIGVRSRLARFHCFACAVWWTRV